MLLKDRKFLLCFGAQRGGTTWLDLQLRQHPGFSFPPYKEIRYLDPIYVHDFANIQQQRIHLFQRMIRHRKVPEQTGITEQESKALLWRAKYSLVSRGNYNDDWYSSLFADVDESKVTGDFSPDYSLLPDSGVEHLFSLVPNTKLIFLLRNPVNRIISGASYAIRTEVNLSPEEREKKLVNSIKSDLQFAFSDYQGIIERYERFFTQSSLKVLYHDDINENPLKIIKEACEWGGAEFKPKYFRESIEKSVNTSKEQQFPEEALRELNRKCMPTLEWLANRYGGRTEKWLEQAKRSI